MNDDKKIEEKAQPSENGFYLLPISQKKNYRLVIRSTKKDLKFTPESYELKLANMDEEQAQNTYNSESFNFKLAGFTLHQAVRFQGELPGSTFAHELKKGIAIQLLQNKALLAQTTTDQHGDFQFGDISPGEYLIKVDDESPVLRKFKSTSFKCVYSWERGSVCEGGLFLVGSQLTRRITLSGEPIKRGILHIKSLADADLSHCIQASKKQGLPIAKGFDCSAQITDSLVTFADMPFGKYRVQVQFENKYILVDPKQLDIAHPADKEETLSFNGFSQGQQGRVVTPKGNGIEGVIIKIDGEQKYVTTANGYFNLDKLKIGTYDFEATHQHYVFKPFVLKIDGDSEKILEKIMADMILLCGRVDFLQKGSESSSGYQVNVQIESNDGREKRNTKIKPDGTYCYEVPAGTYIVKAAITHQDKTLSVTPKQRTVVLDNDPILNVDFSREKLSIKGTVEYLAATPEKFRVKTEILMYNSEQELLKTYQLNGESTFEFNDLFEEGYFIRVINPHLCFEKDTLGENDYTSGAKFVNKGIRAQYSTRVPFQATINGQEKIRFNPKSTELCLNRVGKLEFVVDDTFTFKNNMNSFEYDSASENPKPLNFEVDSIKLRGTINIDTANTKAFEQLLAKLDGPGNLKIIASRKKGQATEATLNKVADNLFEFTLNTKLNTDLQIKPVFKGSDLTDRLVVSPRQINFTVGNLESMKTDLGGFQISIGTIVSVKLSKPLKNVKLRILRRSPEDDTFKAFKVYKSMNFSEGEFKIGPLRRGAEFDVQLTKRGFDFEVATKKDPRGDIISEAKVIEISQVVVKIQTGNKHPLPGVNVYITSTERGNYFKTTVATGEKGGFRKNIQKGEYFIKSVLKEYEFDPPQSVIRVEEGQKKYLKIKAKRTQFSAYGAGTLGSPSQELRRPLGRRPQGRGQLRRQGQPARRVERHRPQRRLLDQRPHSGQELHRESQQQGQRDHDARLPQDPGRPERHQRRTLQSPQLNFVLANQWSIKTLRGQVDLVGFNQQ